MMKSHPKSDPAEMEPGLARELFQRGGALVLLDFPPGCEFGIDYCSWTTAEKFKGVKMIPPGLHFVYFSCVGGRGGRAPRIGFIHNFVEKQVLVRKFDQKTEDLSAEVVDMETVERIRSSLHELDTNLGPYPYNSYREWFSLTNHLRPDVALRIQPRSGRISAQCELVTMESETMLAMAREQQPQSSIAPLSRVDRQHPFRLRFTDERGLPVMKVKPGCELRFTQIPKQRVPSDCRDSSERAAYCMDCSYQLRTLLSTYDDPMDILGELQFSFIIFLIGQVYAAFEQWKRLVHLLCGCTHAIEEYKELYLQLLMCLHFQLKECPPDFFVDIVSANNFLTVTLSNLFTNIESQDKASTALKEKAKKFKTSLTKRFKWNFDVEENPTIVEGVD